VDRPIIPSLFADLAELRDAGAVSRRTLKAFEALTAGGQEDGRIADTTISAPDAMPHVFDSRAQ